MRQSAIEGIRQNEGFFSGELENFAESGQISNLVTAFISDTGQRNKFLEALSPAMKASAAITDTIAANAGDIDADFFMKNMSAARESITNAFENVLGLSSQEMEVLQKELENMNYAQLEKLLKNLGKAATQAFKPMTEAEKEAIRLGKNFAQFKDRIKGVLASQKTSLENLKLDREFENQLFNLQHSMNSAFVDPVKQASLLLENKGGDLEIKLKESVTSYYENAIKFAEAFQKVAPGDDAIALMNLITSRAQQGEQIGDLLNQVNILAPGKQNADTRRLFIDLMRQGQQIDIQDTRRRQLFNIEGQQISARSEVEAEAILRRRANRRFDSQMTLGSSQLDYYRGATERRTSQQLFDLELQRGMTTGQKTIEEQRIRETDLASRQSFLAMQKDLEIQQLDQDQLNALNARRDEFLKLSKEDQALGFDNFTQELKLINEEFANKQGEINSKVFKSRRSDASGSCSSYAQISRSYA